MRFGRERTDHALVVGVFQNPKTGRAVLENLYRARFRRLIAIRASAKGRPRLEEAGRWPIRVALGAAFFGLALGALIVWQRGLLLDYGRGGTALLLFAFALAGALTGAILVRLFRQHIDDASLTWCTSTILPDEMAVIVRVPADDTPRVLAILRDVEEEAPVTFSFYSPPPLSTELTTRPLWPERPSGQRLAENAARLARSIAVSRTMKPRGPSFLHRLREIEQTLEWANDSLTMATEAQQTFALSSEWLLDNAYLIREQVTELRRSLPQESYGELPLIASGPEAGLPRVYRLAAEIVAESGGALDRETIRKFLIAFQEVTPLDIAELWAVPPMLRLRLVEGLRLLAIQVEQQQGESEEADFWANRVDHGRAA